MKLKAKDTLHISSVRADPLRPGEEFEIEDGQGRQLVERGLATEVKPLAAKKAAAPPNKAAPAHKDKAAAAPAKK